jgi:hypothetical protein
MINISNIDTSTINKMALLLGASFLGVLLISLVMVKFFQFLKLPRKFIQTVVSLLAAFGFLYLIVYLGDTFM